MFGKNFSVVCKGPSLVSGDVYLRVTKGHNSNAFYYATGATGGHRDRFEVRVGSQVVLNHPPGCNSVVEIDFLIKMSKLLLNSSLACCNEAECEESNISLTATYWKRGPRLWINGVLFQNSTQLFLRGAILTYNCTVGLGNERSISVGVVYRERVQGWLVNYQYDYRTGTIQSSDDGQLRNGISSVKAAYVLHPEYGNTIITIIKLEVNPLLEWSSIVCYRAAPDLQRVLSEKPRHDEFAVWSEPLRIYRKISLFVA
ncbi:hypothetical protein PoB_001966700 [Plakobranchus ocellatus]|uniref:Ig-like domain-containing protein n=1 Tax=Plakobranchus ocellatus TaxID=259542 RepID=A0AAV3ZF98_9GAST|nr:hypothetical protein PoB_001966700 [Plakobranchus ocellatus]